MKKEQLFFNTISLFLAYNVPFSLQAREIKFESAALYTTVKGKNARNEQILKVEWPEYYITQQEALFESDVENQENNVDNERTNSTLMIDGFFIPFVPSEQKVQSPARHRTRIYLPGIPNRNDTDAESPKNPTLPPRFAIGEDTHDRTASMVTLRPSTTQQAPTLSRWRRFTNLFKSKRSVSPER